VCLFVWVVGPAVDCTLVSVNNQCGAVRDISNKTKLFLLWYHVIAVDQGTHPNISTRK
jgi:hypothetical protein